MKTKRLWLNHLGTHCPNSQGGGWKEQSKPPLDFPTPHSTQLGLGSSSKSRRNGFLKAPTPMRTWFEECDRECYYRFHRNYDHDTKECYNLKNQIEDLIRQDHLDRYARKPREPSLCPKGPVERQIDIIVGGSSADILYFDAFQKLGMTNRDLTLMTSTLTGFAGEVIAPIGVATLPVTFSDEPRTKTLMVPFMVVELPPTYNVIIS
ncbi:hypothetical protein BHM03_00028472 [Ensete ventricosum]|nr:hypothetical protein BHM03_00028472 [Ensete ventricosum]